MPDIHNYGGLEEVILTVFAVVIIILMLGCVYTFLSAIFFFIFSWWKEEQKKKGWNSIRFMLIWVILSVILLFTIPYALNSMNIEAVEEFSVKRVFNRIWEIFDKAFDLWSMIKDAQKENEFRGQMYYDINSNNPNEWYDL